MGISCSVLAGCKCCPGRNRRSRRGPRVLRSGRHWGLFGGLCGGRKVRGPESRFVRLRIKLVVGEEGYATDFFRPRWATWMILARTFSEKMALRSMFLILVMRS